ncbi:MAG: TauD/TfdA family dioxygenase [Alphaproteobacteria bacterium]|nr:TauD/TfdA family dioxygenase [Alphaproteobacteria bacterium]
MTIPAIKQPVTGPSVWTNADMAANEEWIFRLSADHLEEIDAAVKAAHAAPPALYEVSVEDFPLPTLGPALAALSDEVQDGRGFVLIRGIPAERYGDDQLATILWGIGTYFGTGLVQSNKGDRLGHVVDLTGPDTDPRQMRSYESGGSLRMHTDLNQDVVGLMMLRGAKRGGESRIASSMAIHNVILEEHPEYLEPLYRGYYFHIFRHQRVDERKLTRHRIPVFSFYDGALSCHFNPRPIERSVERAGVELSDVEKGAVDFFVEVAARPEIYLDMSLQPGDIQLINNHVILHGRTDYEDHPEPERRRHLLRLWLRCPNARKQAPETLVHETDALGYRKSAAIHGGVAAPPGAAASARAAAD